MHEAKKGSADRTQSQNAAEFKEVQSRTDTLFRAAEARPPLIVWSPDLDTIGHPVLRAFGAKCRMRARKDGLVPSDAMTAEALGLIAPWSLILDVEGQEGPFRYAHYGSRIAEHFGRDMTGETTDAFGGHIAEFFTLIYRAVVRHRVWVLSEHEPPTGVFVSSWRRLIVPFSDDRGQTNRIGVANVPENELRAGLDIIVDPVFVVDEAETVRYANPAARSFFRMAPLDMRPSTLERVTGISLDTNMSPDMLVSTGEIFDRIELIEKNGLMERVAVTVRGVRHRKRSFYGVVMRLLGG